MKAKLENGHDVWIHWPDQCRLCKGYFFSSENKPCRKERTQDYINSLRELEHSFPGVYGTTEFRCDYFCLDEEKFHKDPIYSQQEIGCCAG